MRIALEGSASLVQVRTFSWFGIVLLGAVFWAYMVYAGASVESVFLMLLGSFFFCRQSRGWSKRAVPQTMYWRWAIWGCCSLLVGFFSGILFFFALSWCLLLTCWVKVFTQQVLSKRFAQFMMVMLFMFPWVTVDTWWIEWYARLSAASVAEVVLQWAGFEVVRTGVHLFAQGVELYVAPSCAGFNTLEGTLFFGTILTYYFLSGSLWFWGALCCLPVLAWFANIIRVGSLCWAVAEWGPSFLTEVLHQWGGLIILSLLMLAYVGLLAYLRTLVSNCYES